MRGKDFNIGLRGVLLEVRHYERMGSAVWLYAWLVLRQTHQTGTVGWVLGGAPISYKEIEHETGFNVRTIERWMRTLRLHGYVETESGRGGVIVRITKAKKHAQTARHPAKDQSGRNLFGTANGVRKHADAPRISAEGSTRNCGAGDCEIAEKATVPAPICSSSIEECMEKYEEVPSALEITQGQRGMSPQFENHTPTRNLIETNFDPRNPSRLGESQNRQTTPPPTGMPDSFAGIGRTSQIRVRPPQTPWLSRDEVRLQLEMLRAEREDAVRRELCVGRGPDVSTEERSGLPEVAKPRHL